MADTEARPPPEASSEAPISDLPNGDAVPPASASAPAPIPPASSSSPAVAPTTTPRKKSSAAAVSPLRSADVFLTHLHRCLQTPAGIDTVLLCLCYSSRLAGALLSSAAPAVAGARKSPPTAAAAATAARLMTGTSARLRALSALCSDFRTTMRLWGLLGMYLWAKGLALSARRASSSAAGEKGKEAKATRVFDAATAVSWTQLVLCVLFQALENAYQLGAKGVLPLSPRAQGAAVRWSTRFWAAYVGTELGRLAAEGAAMGRRHRRGVSAAGGKGGGEGESKAPTGPEVAAWRKQLARNAAWAPLTIHWSLEGGLPFVGDGAIGLLASIPGWIQMRDLWRQTALPPPEAGSA